MAGWVETARGVAFPWLCDHFGHLSARNYLDWFDDGGFHIWTLVGVSHKEMRERGLAIVVARFTINYVHELKAGDLLVVKGAFTKVGTKSIATLQKMYNADTQELAATMESVEVFFDPTTRTSAPMPDDIRARLLPHVVAVA